ncbi:facilitated trehalose transporter Tret1-like [Leptopilina heterotoma]|uniref:facilitated trehalose transporter Tret1-like n=1 Tax=Leptopilina heterotoma TaxID=63436 RepID=UPI001CA81E5A|nr:facilitated trehalose transporter Tret1-like [Leptopilina heterotoma]XP_043483100.1 facilitated trehalose transporter Tret1-like [Leptopilina heterotoma]
MKFGNLFCLNSSSRTLDIQEKAISDNESRKKSAYLRQFISILCGYVLMIDVGVQVSWSSPALDYLKDNRTENYLTNEEGGFLTSLDAIASIIGFLTYPLLMNRVGRRYTIFVYALIQLSAWIVLNLANSYLLLCIGRIIVGTGYGGSFGFLTIYIGEMTERNVRGMFLSLDKICVNLGGFIVNAAGVFLSYRNMNMCMSVIPIIALGLFPLMLETPYFYLLKGQEKKAIETQMLLSGEKYPQMVSDDIERMKKTIKECEDSEKNVFHELFSDRGSRRGLIIKLITEFTYAFSGFLAIQSYVRQIFEKSGSTLEPGYCAMIVSGVQVIAGVPASQLVDRWGRRPVYLFSGFASAINLSIIGGYFFFYNYMQYDMSSVSWIPLVCMVLLQIVLNMGVSTMPYIYSGELFSVKVKGLACMLSSLCHSVFGFICKFLLPVVVDSFGLYSAFWFFAIVCIVGPIIVFNISPETKGKHLEEVLELLNESNKKHTVKENSVSKL